MKHESISTFRNQIGDGQICMMRYRARDDAPHRHVFFELVYVLGGSALHCLEDQTVRLHAGDYFIIDPGSVHCYQEVEGLEIINCLFLPEYVDRALKDCPSLSVLLSNQALCFGVPVDNHIADRTFRDSDGAVGKCIRRMEQEYAQRRTGYMELLRCGLTQMLVSAVRAAEELEKSRHFHEATTAVTEYLYRHYAEPLSLSELSARVGYTPQYLSSLFHKDTGMCIQVFLQRLRVEEACRLINAGERSAGDMALAVGYSDIKYFARIFRRYKGMTVKEYRTRQKAE